MRQLGRFGGLFVRCGKHLDGSPPKRRTVLTVPEMDWVTEYCGIGWTRSVRCSARRPSGIVGYRAAGPHFLAGINEAFEEARGAAGLPSELDLHSCGIRYEHLVEFGYPERFVPEQAGHSYASTTAIYTGVSDEFRNRLLAKTLRERYAGRGGKAVTKKMGIRWHLRLRMAEKGLFQTSDLVPLLAERGIQLSREQVYRLVTQVPSACRPTRWRRCATSWTASPTT